MDKPMKTISTILIGSKNAGKIKEIEQILAPLGIRLVSLQDFPTVPEVFENGVNYEANAVLKATVFSKATGLPCLAEDSGLEVTVLHNKPGIYSARWAGIKGKDRDRANNVKLLQKLERIPLAQRDARFVCVAVLCLGSKILLKARGECHGRITFLPRGHAGFGYDPLFELPEYQKTFAELGDSIKNQISHRARAMVQLAVKLQDIELPERDLWQEPSQVVTTETVASLEPGPTPMISSVEVAAQTAAGLEPGPTSMTTPVEVVVPAAPTATLEPGPAPTTPGQPLENGQTTPSPSVRKQVELSPIHDFAAKLLQGKVLPKLKEYVRWQIQRRQALQEGKALTDSLAVVPDCAPLSINLDMTTACNFACDHCVDKPILNQGSKFEHEQLLASLTQMAAKGLASVIVIGGGEPTLYPKFAEVIRHLKTLGMQVSIVTNGTGNDKIAEIIELFDENDWVRLSLDAGSEETFQALHKPRKQITLDQICEGIPVLKKINPKPKIGFSYVITWQGAAIFDVPIVENIHEIVPAAQRAKNYGFDYIAYKPFLTRAISNNAEVIGLTDAEARFDAIIDRIHAAVQEAKQIETPQFRVYETTNLKVLVNKSYRNYTDQPVQCHLQFFRQVLSPLGLFNCSAYRNQPCGKLGEANAYGDQTNFVATRQSLAQQITNFDAHTHCCEVTCLYNHTNWWIEDLIAHPDKLDNLQAVEQALPDYFL